MVFHSNKKEIENNIVIPKAKKDDSKIINSISKIKPKSEYENIRNIVNGNQEEVQAAHSAASRAGRSPAVRIEHNKNIKNKFQIA